MKLNARHLVPVAAASLAIAGLAAGVAGAAQSPPPLGAYTTSGAYSFATAPKLHPPKLKADARPGKGRPGGYFMLANFKDLTQTTASGVPKPMAGQSGPLILDSNLAPVWFRPVPENVLANNLAVQTYAGKPALSWWQGVVTNTGAIVSGEFVVVNQHYKQVATLTGAPGWVIALHEMVIKGTDAWVIASRTVPGSDYGQSASVHILDTAVQEYDLKTGKLLQTWDPLAHIPLSDSYQQPLANGVWDAYHANSLQLGPGGTFLVSLRNTWGAYMVDASSGKVQWQLGGKPVAGATQYTVASKGRFEWQHDVKLNSGNVVTLFDDACCAITGPSQFGPTSGPSRGLVLKLDSAKHTASFVAQYVRGAKFNAAFLGSTQLLPGGGALVGWGSQPYFSEYAKSGRRVLDVVLPRPDLSYRVQLENWVGLPSYPPTGAVRKRSGGVTVYASWNGATRVASWQVLGGRDAHHMTQLARHGKSGFETGIAVKGTASIYRVLALDSKGHVIGRSATFSIKKKKSSAGTPGFY